MGDVIYSSEINSSKIGVACTVFGIAAIIFGMSLFGDPKPFPAPIDKFLWNYPGFRGAFGLMAEFAAVLSIVFGALISDIGVRCLFSSRYKGMFFCVSSKAVSVPSFLAGLQYVVPSEDIISAAKLQGRVTIAYRVGEGESNYEAPAFSLDNADDFVEAVNKLASEKSEGRTEEGVGKKLFSVYFGPENNKAGRHDDGKLRVLARLQKRPVEELEKEYVGGGVLVRGGLSGEKAKKLKEGLRKYNIGSTIKREERDVDSAGKGPDEPTNKLAGNTMPIIAPTFATTLATFFIPGGLFAWLAMVYYMAARVGVKMNINWFVVIAAVAGELFLYLGPLEDAVTALFRSGVGAGVAIYVGFGVKRALEGASNAKLSSLMVALFPVPYVNYKINETVLNSTNEKR